MNKNLPTISSYGEYSNNNYGVHCLRVDLGPIDLYYSYDTIVAYRDIQDGLVVRQNSWSVTTGKHLNWLDRGDKKSRLPGDEFDKKLNDALARHIQ